MKNLNLLTINEWNKLLELLNTKKKKDLDLVSIFELLEEDYTQLSAGEFQKRWNYIKSFFPQKTKVERYYILNGKKYKVLLNLAKLKAAQFIDLQTIIQSGNKLEDVISIFLIPTKKSLFRNKELNYGEGYDILELRQDILNHMTISDAFTLSDFFFSQSQRLLEVTKGYLTKKMVVEKNQMMEKKLKDNLK